MTETNNTVLVLFSSGMDSLWVALYYLKIGRKVRLLYIGIPRINGAKVLAEKYFAKRLYKMLRHEFKELVTLDIIDNKRKIGGFSGWTQMKLWFEGVEKAYNGEYEIAMGTTWDDIRTENPTIKDLRERRKKWSERFGAKISFPGVMKCKKVMAVEMLKYMRNTWTCEIPFLAVEGSAVRISACVGKEFECDACAREKAAERYKLRKPSILLPKARLTERDIIECQLLYHGTVGSRSDYEMYEKQLNELEVA